MLVRLHKWELLSVDHTELHEGDLIFAKSKRRERLVQHVALYASGKVHHACPRGFIEETVSSFMERHEQPYGDETGSPTHLLRHTDARNIFKYVLN